MMRLLVKALLLWGIIDSFALAKNPKGWQNFWSGALDKLSESPGLSKGIAGAQFALCMWLLKRI